MSELYVINFCFPLVKESYESELDMIVNSGRCHHTTNEDIVNVALWFQSKSCHDSVLERLVHGIGQCRLRSSHCLESLTQYFDEMDAELPPPVSNPKSSPLSRSLTQYTDEMENDMPPPVSLGSSSLSRFLTQYADEMENDMPPPVSKPRSSPLSRSFVQCFDEMENDMPPPVPDPFHRRCRDP